MDGSPSGLYTLTSNVTIPSGVTNITLDLRAGGDLNSSNEFFNVYFNGVQYGGDWNTGIQDCNLYDLTLDDTVTSLLNICFPKLSFKKLVPLAIDVPDIELAR